MRVFSNPDITSQWGYLGFGATDILVQKSALRYLDGFLDQACSAGSGVPDPAGKYSGAECAGSRQISAGRWLHGPQRGSLRGFLYLLLRRLAEEKPNPSGPDELGSLLEVGRGEPTTAAKHFGESG